MSASNPTTREFAALAFALGIARGALQSAMDGSADAQELQMVLDGTSVTSIANALDQAESDLALDWNEYLTEDEKRAISGVRGD